MTEFDLSIRGRCILSAEDNEVSRLVLQHIFDEQEIPYLIVDDGAQAVEAWRVLNPLVIFMDISMPVMNGLEAIQNIRQIEAGSGRHVPIVALTAHALSGDGRRILEVGADHYLTKPINPNTLLAKILEVVDHEPMLAVV